MPPVGNSLQADLQGNHFNPDQDVGINWTNDVHNLVRPLRSVNSYGLFRVMTKTDLKSSSKEVTNGQDWKLYKFKWKPDHANDPLRYSGPHMPRIDWQMWFEGLRAERYLSQPFSRFLYGRFLDIIANGGGQKECFDLNYVLGELQMQAFTNSPPQQKQIIISNFQNLMNAFLQQSTWFGKLLKACFEPNLIILDELESIPFVNQPPQFLRVSLSHFQFPSNSETDNTKVWVIKQNLKVEF